MEHYYSKNGKTFATIDGKADNGKTIFSVYYGGRLGKQEIHKIKLYEWAKHLHGNPPSGTPYGYFLASRTKERIIITI